MCIRDRDCSKNHVEELGVRLTIEQAVRKLPEEIRETADVYKRQAGTDPMGSKCMVSGTITSWKTSDRRK